MESRVVPYESGAGLLAVINRAARLFGALWIFVGLGFGFVALVSPEDRLLYGLLGVLGLVGGAVVLRANPSRPMTSRGFGAAVARTEEP